MPANLPPEYIEAELRYRAAKTAQEKLEILKQMMSLVPKHKGTETLRVDLKRRWTKLQQEAQKKPQAARGPSLDHIEREGAGQIALVGLPNCGKSTLLATVTNAKPEIADYPYSTFRPTVGMMAFEDIQLQLIDLPPLSDFTEPWVFSLMRQADGLALLLDLSDEDPGERVRTIRQVLEKQRIALVGRGDLIPPAGAIGGTVRPALILGTKREESDADLRLHRLREAFAGEFAVVGVSAHGKSHLDEMRRALFDLLGIVRAYTKKPGQPPSRDQPYVLRQGSTVFKVAQMIHHEIAEKMKFARVWGSAEFPGQRVERDHLLQDGDILEIHF